MNHKQEELVRCAHRHVKYLPIWKKRILEFEPKAVRSEAHSETQEVSTDRDLEALMHPTMGPGERQTEEGKGLDKYYRSQKP